MRHPQSTGAEAGWSSASADGLDKIGFDRLRDSLAGAPTWALALGAIVAAVVVVVLGTLAVRASARQWAKARDRRADQRHKAGLPPSGGIAEFGAQSLPALGGVAVSLFGLWGFSTDQAHLPFVLRIGFIATFDVAELTLFWMLHRAADARRGTGWSPGMRRTQALAWTLVAFSAAMNAVHASNWWGRVILAAIPVLAARLIELQVLAKLYGDGEIAEDNGGRPGPLRLVVLIWQHTWSELFSWMGLDAGSTQGQIARAARARRAARDVYLLRKALTATGANASTTSNTSSAGSASNASRGRKGRRVSEKQLDKLRAKAQAAIERADLATDNDQALDVTRRFAGMSRIDHLALVEVEQPDQVVALLREIAITPSIAAMDAKELLAEGTAERERAMQEAAELREQIARETEAARQRTEAARQKDEAARQRTEAAQLEAETARQEAERVRKEAGEEVARLLEEAHRQVEVARQEAASSEAARQEGEAARQAAEAEQQAAEAERDRLRAAETEAAQQLQRARQEADALRAESERLKRETAAARLLLDRLGGELTRPNEDSGDADPGAAPGTAGPAYRSLGKQLGWELYQEKMRAEVPDEPTDKELADLGGVAEGRARGWLGEFRRRFGNELTLTIPTQGSAPAVHLPSESERNRATEQFSRADGSGLSATNGSHPHG